MQHRCSWQCLSSSPQFNWEDRDVDVAQPEARKAPLSQRAHQHRVRTQLLPWPAACALHAHARRLHACMVTPLWFSSLGLKSFCAPMHVHRLHA